MMEDSLYKFYTGLIPNVVAELFFYIPKDKIPQEILRKNSVLRSGLILDKVFVFDTYSGPVPYNVNQSYSGTVLLASNLEKNTFSLIQKKGEVNAESFKFLIDKYVSFIQLILELSNWMNENLDLFFKTDSKLKGYFNLQCFNLKNHIEFIETRFNKPPLIVPFNNWIESNKIERLFKDANKGFAENNLPKFEASLTKFKSRNEGSKDQKVNTKGEGNSRKPLVSESKAEEILLKTYFGINKIQ